MWLIIFCVRVKFLLLLVGVFGLWNRLEVFRFSLVWVFLVRLWLMISGIWLLVWILLSRIGVFSLKVVIILLLLW